MKKILITFAYLSLLILVNAQKSTIDVGKVHYNLSFSILRDTLTLGNDLVVSYGDSRSKIEEFLENSLNNKPSVHISSDDNYYYNSYALSLLYEKKVKIKENGFEFLSPKDFDNNSLVINNQTLNIYPIKLKKIIKTNSNIGSIFNDAEKKINKEELYFRIPEFNSEKCIESFNVYSSNVIYVDFSKNTISEMKNPEESMHRCTDGYGILMKETFDHYLKRDDLDYFEIMPDLVRLEFRKQLFSILKNQNWNERKDSVTFKLTSSFSNTGIQKIEIDGLKKKFSLMKKIETVTNKYCIIPFYESNFIMSSFSMLISYSYNGTRLKTRSVENIQHEFKVDVLSLFTPNVEVPYLLKEKVLCRKMDVNININGENQEAQNLSILRMKKPSYLISLNSFLGQGYIQNSNLEKFSKWFIPITGLMAVGSHLLSVNRYDFYVSNLNTDNNIKVYNTANLFNKLSFCCAGLYFLTSSLQLSISIKNIKDRRQKVDIFNVKYPGGVNISIPNINP